MPNREVGDNDPSVDRLLGELVSEVRSVKHNQQNASSKLDAVAHLVEQVKEMREEQIRHNARLAVLEADKARRDGALGLVSWFSRNWPMTVILAALAWFVGWATGVKPQ